MNETTPAVSDRQPRGRKRLNRSRLLIVGCGDVGGRIVALARGRLRVIALTSNPARVPALRAAGVVPIVGNLDDRRSLRRMGAFGARVIHLAPPPEAGSTDPRTRHLLAALRACGRLVYISTSGVYGDCGGAWLDETARPMPLNDRAYRRLDAERSTHAPEDDMHTNHIHADDLAHITLAALFRGKPARVYHAVDDSQLKMGEYFDLVADAHALPHPPRLPREQLRAAVSPMMYSFMAESRRLRNTRLKRELRVRLRWPTVRTALERSPDEGARAP
jgi:nucleoside-diphosphate-sugar epimerase